MSDVLTLEPPPAATCTNCGAPMHGRFCAACGQEAKPLDPPVRHVVRELAQEFFDVDGRILRSLKRLFFSPGFLTVEHFEGRRAPWVSPLKLYLLTSVAAFAMLAFAGTDAGLRIAVVPTKGQVADESWVQALGYGSMQELSESIATAREVWVPRVMFVLVPFFAWLVARVRRRDARHYPAHLVFALHVHAAAFAMRAVMNAVGLVVTAPAARWLDTIVLVYAIGYVYLAFRRVYGVTRLRATLDLTAVGVVYWLAVLVCAGAAVLTAALGADGLLRLVS